MLTESKNPNKISDTPRDKPQGDRVEHANLERPGAASHPRMRAAADWSQYMKRPAWRLH
ncbi:hypothetical protein [Ramlibacter henchirensis]|uniref:hypothetical protein n=1 Tax=Ramlibacter henchirensis TaxID=204072 RepID=UPI00142FCE99|nr:hypothetical protein [Ramlibacter henchirensis]